MDNPGLQQAIITTEQKLAGQGRVLVRPSGTEPILRLMAEGPDKAELERLIGEMAELVQALE